MMIRLSLALVSGLLLTSAAQAGTGASPAGCMMTVLAPVAAVENPRAVMSKGMSWGPATQMRIRRADGHVT